MGGEYTRTNLIQEVSWLRGRLAKPVDHIEWDVRKSRRGEPFGHAETALRNLIQKIRKRLFNILREKWQLNCSRPGGPGHRRTDLSRHPAQFSKDLN